MTERNNPVPDNEAQDALWNALRWGQPKRVREYFDTYGDSLLNAPIYDDNRTPLIIAILRAAEFCVPEHLEEYLKNGFRPADKFTKTENLIQNVLFLLQRGADPNAAACGETPLGACLADGRTHHLVRALIGHGVDLHGRAGEKTPARDFGADVNNDAGLRALVKEKMRETDWRAVYDGVAAEVPVNAAPLVFKHRLKGFRP